VEPRHGALRALSRENVPNVHGRRQSALPSRTERQIRALETSPLASAEHQSARRACRDAAGL